MLLCFHSCVNHRHIKVHKSYAANCISSDTSIPQKSVKTFNIYVPKQTNKQKTYNTTSTHYDE